LHYNSIKLMSSGHKRVSTLSFLKYGIFFIFAILLYSCSEKKPSKDVKIVTKVAELNGAVAVQLEELLNEITDTTKKSTLKVYNPHSVKAFYNPDYTPIFTNNMGFTNAGASLKKFIDKDCKYFGLFPKAYHATNINKLFTTLTNDSSKMNAVEWAKAELYMTDAFFQIAKHIKNGRLYADTNYRYHDTSLTKNVFTPLLNNFVKQPLELEKLLSTYEPKLHDYDSLKIYLKKMLNQAKEGEKEYSTVIFPYTDSLRFIKSLVNRFREEGLAASATDRVDSFELAELIKGYQVKYSQTPTGKYSKEMIDNMNMKSDTKFAKIALTMDKFKNFKITNNGSYVIVNIPSYTLRGYTADTVAVESRVAVGKTASKTPVMESEISDIIVMPNWYVPPSILKIPGYIERHRGRKNFVVRGRSVMQKAGPGNALGEMKFNFKSGDAIYLHDTNEKWAFSSSYRAVSHGCVRVQQYKALGNFISKLSPLYEKDYEKVFDKIVIDSIKHDTTTKYKYLVKDSVFLKGDSIVTRLLKNKVHRELTVQKKVPIYIKYFTCAVRNGIFILYNDVYGYDKALQEKYFSGYL
jgi:L,D-transpeptidase YcbB